MSNQSDSKIHNGIKLAGEAFVLPGSSLMVDGKIKSGIIHAGAGVLAKAVLGVPGLVVVAANSFSLSVTGRSLYSTLFDSPNTVSDNLAEQVRREMAAGKTLDEIQEGIGEDIADLYAENGEQ